jgi:hypothetical protein
MILLLLLYKKLELLDEEGLSNFFLLGVVFFIKYHQKNIE